MTVKWNDNFRKTATKKQFQFDVNSSLSDWLELIKVFQRHLVIMNLKIEEKSKIS